MLEAGRREQKAGQSLGSVPTWARRGNYYFRADIDFSKLPRKDPGFYFPQNKWDIWLSAGKEYKSRVTSPLIFE